MSSTRKTVALGSKIPASACTAKVSSPSGAFGISTHNGPSQHDEPGITAVEGLRFVQLAMQRVIDLEDVAEGIGIGGRERDRAGSDDARVEQDDHMVGFE